MEDVNIIIRGLNLCGAHHISKLISQWSRSDPGYVCDLSKFKSLYNPISPPRLYKHDPTMPVFFVVEKLGSIKGIRNLFLTLESFSIKYCFPVCFVA